MPPPSQQQYPPIMSVWNPDNIKDVAESVGITSLNDDVLQGLCSDIEYRVSQVLEAALKFMRHSKRSTLSTQDISQALRVLDVEPLYGYESTRPLRFGEASIGPGQPLFYVEEEELDFEKLINAPLPKVPREMSFTAHWLAIEGVQPAIPQNPTTAESRTHELMPKGPGANPTLAAIGGSNDSNITVKPLVKHVLSKELQLYFGKVCSALMDEGNDEYRVAALASIRSDPGLHQLVPYFVQYIAEKVTHNMKNLFVLTQVIHLTSAMLDNESLYVDPYIASLIPSILTCLIGRHIGTNPLSHYPLRDLSASLLGSICKKYSKTSHTLRSRLARTCLKHMLDPTKPFAVNYGGIIGLQATGGEAVVRVLILPNMKEFVEGILGDALLLEDSEVRKREAELIVGALVKALIQLDEGGGSLSISQSMNGGSRGEEEVKDRLSEKIGGVMAERVFALGKPGLAGTILETFIP